MHLDGKQSKRPIEWMTHVKNSGGYEKTLQPMASRFDNYLSEYEHIFRSKTKFFFDRAKDYCQGVFLSEMCNIERISEEMSADYSQMQHFITESPWDHRKLIDQVAQEVSRSLPTRKLTGLIIDESGWEKKGKKSVGVAPQYCGNLGKVANCQVAVFGTLSKVIEPVEIRGFRFDGRCPFVFAGILVRQSGTHGRSRYTGRRA